MFATKGFLGLCYRMMSIKFYTTTDPGCHGNEISDKSGYNSAHTENTAVPLVFVGGLLIDVRQILPVHEQPHCHGNEI